MTKRTGSQLSKSDVLGVACDVINGTIVTKRGLQRVLERVLDVTDRQARAAVSSYIAEGWTQVQTGTRPRINEGICEVSSASARVNSHAGRRDEARRENIRKSDGRPRKS